MQIQCPNCHNTLEYGQADAAGDIICSACGSGFRLADKTTLEWRAGEPRRVGKFELLDLVGSGGFGSVFKARDPELDRIVAVKVPRSGPLTAPAEVDRFLRELRSLARLRHPNIVPIYEVGQADQLPYLVSEFVQGVTLTDWLSARRPEPAAAARLTATLAEALHYAHAQGVIHRDVKPANIMLRDVGRSEPADGSSLAAQPPLVPLLMDFGLAKRDGSESTLTVDGQVMGTPAYMSPEQARGEGHKVDGRCDVYSLGVILFQLLTGELPFKGTARMMLHQVLTDDAPSPRRSNPHLHRDLETICMKAMAKEPARRYATAGALAEDLRRFLSGQAILARPPGILERTVRAVKKRRHEITWGLIGAAVVVIAFLVFGYPFGDSLAPNGGERKNAPEGELSADLALVPPEAFGFICLEASAMRDNPAAQRLFSKMAKEWHDVVGSLESTLGVKAAEVERVIFFVLRGEKDGAVSAPITIFTATTAFDRTKILSALGEPSQEKKTARDFPYYVRKTDPKAAPQAPGHENALHFVNDRTLITGPEKELLRILDRPPDKSNPWRAALKLAGKKHVILAGLYPPEFLRHWVSEDILRRHAALRPLLECQASTVALALDDNAELKLDVSFDFPPQVMSQERQKAVKKALSLLEREVKRFLTEHARNIPHQVSLMLEQMEKGLRQAPLERHGDSVTVQLKLQTDGDMIVASLQSAFAPFALSVRIPTDRVISANNLRQIAIAMHNYQQRHKSLPPPAIYDKDGKPLLSWRVALLPYLELNDLYKEFHLDEAWDSPHNSKLLERMPQIYKSVPRHTDTHYQVFVGPGAAFEGTKGLSLENDFPDGTSNTLLLVEAAEQVPWTKPEDLPFDPKGPLPKFRAIFPEGFHIVTADGVVHLVREIESETLRALIMRNDGQPIDWNKVKR